MDISENIINYLFNHIKHKLKILAKMNKTELIIFAITFVISAAVIADFLIFNIKSGARTAYFSKVTWRIGFLTTIALVYWYMNGMRFL